MSRSYRHTPISGIACRDTEKQDKRRANRKLRRITRSALRQKRILPLVREVSNRWLFGKDGKSWKGQWFTTKKRLSK